MPSVLHLLKPDSAPQALAVIERYRAGVNVTVVLIHGAPRPPLPPGVTVHSLAENDREGTLSHSDLLDFIFSADQVIAW